MSISYAVFCLKKKKLIDCPTSTLNGSAKPEMVVPWPFATSQTDGGEPGSAFSQATGLAQLACAAASLGAAPVSAQASSAAMATALSLRVCLRIWDGDGAMEHPSDMGHQELNLM